MTDISTVTSSNTASVSITDHTFTGVTIGSSDIQGSYDKFNTNIETINVIDDAVTITSITDNTFDDNTFNEIINSVQLLDLTVELSDGKSFGFFYGSHLLTTAAQFIETLICYTLAFYRKITFRICKFGIRFCKVKENW